MKVLGVILVGLMPVFACACSTLSETEDPNLHDMLCIASVVRLSGSSDETVRRASPVVVAYYVGKLTKTGLSHEAIQSEIDKIAISTTHPEILQKPFAEDCAKEFDVAMHDLNATLKKDKDAVLRKQFSN